MRSQPDKRPPRTPSVREDRVVHREGRGGSHVHTAGGSLAGNDASPMSSTLGGGDGGAGASSPATTGVVSARSDVGSSMEPVSPLRPCRAMGAAAQKDDGGTPRWKEP